MITLRKDNPQVAVIVPTYNERPNVRPLSERLAAVAESCTFELHWLIVDDSSPDGTAQAARAEAQRHGGRMSVLERQGPRGLALAVIDGFRATRSEYLAVMDGDLSHRPEEVPALIEPLVANEAEFALGSRFLPGARHRMSLFRRLNSWIPTVLSRPIAPVRDPMSGFFAFPRRLLERAGRLDPVGYKIGLELLVKSRPARVAEVPIRFDERTAGKSKLGWKERAEFLRHLTRLYLPIYLARTIHDSPTATALASNPGSEISHRALNGERPPASVNDPGLASER